MNTIIIHPIIVHFPIALLIIGSLAAISSKLTKGKLSDNIYTYACISVIIGALSTIVAILSGFLFTKEMVGIMGDLRTTHIYCALISVVCGLVTAILMVFYLWNNNYKIIKNLSIIFSIITAIMIGITGHYGGLMVFA